MALVDEQQQDKLKLRNPDDLINALQDPAVYPHPVVALEVLETHISWIILTGDFAYKIKKPVDLGFLDFSSLEKRHFFCQQELRINSRLAPQIYLDVVPITGSTSTPVINGEGPVIDYAVRMRQFPQDHRLDCVLEDDRLTTEHVISLAEAVAKFHNNVAAVAGEDSTYGAPSSVGKPMEENFSQIEPLLNLEDDKQKLARVRNWYKKELELHLEDFANRKYDGFVRECHGDLHLGNIALLDDIPVLFDAIEFNDEFRWIDVMSDVAFLFMDLYKRKRPDLAMIFLNRYLEETGDYSGLIVLRYYLVYRALVRAKVDCIRAHQADLDADQQQAIMRDYRAYVELATKLTQTPQTALFIMHGLSGSGKTTVAGELAKCIPAIRLRSDIERKRLYGLAADAKTHSKPGAGLYDAKVTERTYTILMKLSQSVVSAGFSVIVDASFLDQAMRKRFAEVARVQEIPFIILHCEVSKPDLLTNRVIARKHAGRDASEANLEVLERQVQLQQPLTNGEIQNCKTINTGEQLHSKELCHELHQLVHMERGRQQ